MENIKEKVAYLKGLSDGLGIDHETKEGKVLLAIIDILDDMAEEISYVEEGQAELDEYVDAIDQDLAIVEEDLYGEEDDEDDFDEEDDGYIEIECPNCNETIFLDEEMLDDEDDEEIICPNCNEPIVFETECCCGEDHGHHHHDDHDCNCK